MLDLWVWATSSLSCSNNSPSYWERLILKALTAVHQKHRRTDHESVTIVQLLGATSVHSVYLCTQQYTGPSSGVGIVIVSCNSHASSCHNITFFLTLTRKQARMCRNSPLATVKKLHPCVTVGSACMCVSMRNAGSSEYDEVTGTADQTGAGWQQQTERIRVRESSEAATQSPVYSSLFTPLPGRELKYLHGPK